jgi:hypothetical protein
MYESVQHHAPGYKGWGWSDHFSAGAHHDQAAQEHFGHMERIKSDMKKKGADKKGLQEHLKHHGARSDYHYEMSQFHLGEADHREHGDKKPVRKKAEAAWKKVRSLGKAPKGFDHADHDDHNYMAHEHTEDSYHDR